MKSTLVLFLGIMSALAYADAPTDGTVSGIQATGEYVRLQRTLIHVSGSADLSGKPVEISEGRRVLSRGRFAEEGGKAVAHLTLPMPPLHKSYGTLTVRTNRKPVASLVLPDPDQERLRAFREADLQYERVFSGDAFPKIEFKTPGWVEHLIGPYTIQPTFYDAAFSQIASAEKPGRYGAVIQVKTEDGRTYPRYETLYRLPNAIDLERMSSTATVNLPKEVGIDPAVLAAQSAYLNEYASRRMLEGFTSDPNSGVLLAGLSETKADEPAVYRTGAFERNRRWWYSLRRKLGEKPYQYLLSLPKGYEKDSEKRWPVILFLHGAGERGSNLEMVKVHGPPKIAPKRENFPFIVISPQCPEGEYWLPVEVIDVLDEVCAKCRVDPDRIYLTGLSMGGYGTWNTTIEYPNRFAAIAPICGGGDPADADRIKHIPAWVFHGGKDTVVPIQADQAMVDALKTLGADARFTVYPEAGHDSWTVTYDNPELYAWFLSHRRSENHAP